MQEANATTSGSVAETFNTIKEVSGLDLILMPVLLGQTVSKQCLANPCNCRDLEAWLAEKGLDAADVFWIPWVTMHNGTKVDWLMYPHCNEVVVDWKRIEYIHQYFKDRFFNVLQNGFFFV